MCTVQDLLFLRTLTWSSQCCQILGLQTISWDTADNVNHPRRHIDNVNHPLRQ